MMPIELLAEVINKVIFERWFQIRNSDSLVHAPSLDLRNALAYLNQQAHRIHKIEYDNKIARLMAEQEEMNKDDDKMPANFLPTLVILGIIIIVLIAAYPVILLYIVYAVIGIGLFYILTSAFLYVGTFIITEIKKLIDKFIPTKIRHNPSIGIGARLIFLLTIFVTITLNDTKPGERFSVLYLFIIFMFMMIAIPGLLSSEFSFAMLGGGSQWIRNLTSKAIESERLAIVNILANSSSQETSENQAYSSSNVTETNEVPLPAPPGITEIVLKESEADVFKDIRAHLTSVRLYHRIVLWAVIIAFMTFLGVGIFKLLDKMQSANDYLQAFGSAGIGSLLLWFSQRALWANRVSQLSLALFESYVAEVSASLREIPQSASFEERRHMRAEIWASFRTGLNRIWLTEKRLLGNTDTSSSIPDGPKTE